MKPDAKLDTEIDISHSPRPLWDGVDFALAHNKPFAVVPCCVYSKEFDARRDATTGLRVGTMSYQAFCRFLVAKDPQRIRVATLPFEGKNLVVYSAPEGGCVPCEE